MRVQHRVTLKIGNFHSWRWLTYTKNNAQEELKEFTNLDIYVSLVHSFLLCLDCDTYTDMANFSLGSKPLCPRLLDNKWGYLLQYFYESDWQSRIYIVDGIALPGWQDWIRPWPFSATWSTGTHVSSDCVCCGKTTFSWESFAGKIGADFNSPP